MIGLRAWVKTDEYWTTRWRILEEIKLTFDEGDKYGYEHTTIINLHKFIAQKIVEKGIDY